MYHTFFRIVVSETVASAILAQNASDSRYHASGPIYQWHYYGIAVRLYASSGPASSHAKLKAMSSACPSSPLYPHHI